MDRSRPRPGRRLDKRRPAREDVPVSTPPDLQQRAQTFAAALSRLDEELDWGALGHSYCEEGGEHFFSAEQVDALRDAGLKFASDVADAVADLPAGTAGRSVYLGAGVFDLAPALCEVLVLRRRVFPFTLPGPERDELNRALAIVSESIGEELPSLRDDAFVPATVGRCDHIWMVSVLTDPDAFPALHDVLYQRHGSDLATGRGSLPRERAKARGLVDSLLSTLEPPALFTTSDEEAVVLADALEERSWRADIPETARLSGIVGDPVRVLRLFAVDQPAATPPGEGRGRRPGGDRSGRGRSGPGPSPRGKYPKRRRQ